MTTTHPSPIRLTRDNAIAHYYQGLELAAATIRAERAERAGQGKGLQESFSPAFTLPPLTPELTAYFGTSGMSMQDLATHRGRRLLFLDLMGNPGTLTTKTFASLVMVARAVEHIRTTGERILILTPTSGNKGTALRDAVARAHAHGLVGADQLRIVTVVPRQSLTKLRESALSTDEDARRANPVALADVDSPAAVKDLASQAAALARQAGLEEGGWRLWYSLDLDNYRLADAARAFVEADAFPVEADGAPRLHAHAVSSAYGLLGYHLGHRTLTSQTVPGLPVPARHPGFFLIQQLATPDMVLSLLKGSPAHELLPPYALDPTTGLYHRGDDDGAFPAVTHDPHEQIDPTFYTRAPVTSAQVNELIGRHGGGGIVVSLHECLAFYPRLRRLLAPLGHELPADPRDLREWSLVKAVTGVHLAIERDLVPEHAEIVIHGSGLYTDRLLAPLPQAHTTAVSTAGDVSRLLLAAASA
ncbi:DUF6002 family protein [Streptomyces sp. NPDC021096]|uniref:DUF6002 family protein n=1 Tax=Streptomyces sp. NPDC021096 TaxID=3154792 RepID=UPI0033C96FEA